MLSVRRMLMRSKSICIHFLFFVSRAGCIEAVCPRFNASSNCIGSRLICSGGKVTRLCVSRERCVVSLRNARLQGLVGPPFDWVDSVDYWTIDGTHYIVRVRVDYYGVETHASGFARRNLQSNQLTSSIPSTIGQLTALTSLYVGMLTLQCWNSHFWLRTQDSCRQPVDKLDSVDDWTIDGTHYIVRVRVDYSVSELTLLGSHAGIFTTTS
jgi:hypothetical protein